MRVIPLFFEVFSVLALVACSGSDAGTPPNDDVGITDTLTHSDVMITTDTTDTTDTSVTTDTSSDTTLSPDTTDATDTKDASRFDAAPSGCITDVSAGAHVFPCDGLTYDVAVPSACTGSACGLVLDVHGATMSGKMEDHNTAMRALGAKYGYVIVQPNANPAPPLSSWTPGTDDDKVFAFLGAALTSYGIDRKRVHMTGFSQGGMMSSRFLCKHASTFGSIAPGAGTGCTFTAGDTPSEEIPVLYMHGTKDSVVAFSYGTAQRDALISAWKLGPKTVVSSSATHEWSRFENAAGTVFEFIQHDYEASSIALHGHCYPGSTDPSGEAGQLFSFACTGTSAFVWGEAVMSFFVAHPRK